MDRRKYLIDEALLEIVERVTGFAGLVVEEGRQDAQKPAGPAFFILQGMQGLNGFPDRVKGSKFSCRRENDQIGRPDRALLQASDRGRGIKDDVIHAIFDKRLHYFLEIGDRLFLDIGLRLSGRLVAGDQLQILSPGLTHIFLNEGDLLRARLGDHQEVKHALFRVHA